METCNCSEARTERTIGYVNNDPKRRIFEECESPTFLFMHDCAYIARRNAVLDQAEKIALEATLPNEEGKRLRHGIGWQQAFNRAVNELSKEQD